MISHKTGTREQGLAVRNELLAKEKELNRRGVRQLVTHAEEGAGRRRNGR